MALKKTLPGVRFNNERVSPDEVDFYQQYQVTNPTTSATWVGTVAGTQTQAAALVLINKNLDYPRNLFYGVVGTADIGGTWTVNGKDQFGNSITESVGSGTAAAGTPAFGIAGTKIFSQVSSGTFTFATSSGQGNGTARVGVAVGGTAGSTCLFGLPSKIAAVTDVKAVTWSKENVTTTLGGGTISSTIVGTANHSFNGTAVLGGTESFTVLLRSSYNSENETAQAGL